MDDIVTLNVGGHIYTTSLSTLTKDRDSMIGAMFSGELTSTKDNRGNYVIDRDGKLFRFVLNFLRSDKLQLPEDFKELEMLLEEAEFYQIKDMVDAVKQVQQQRITHVVERTNLVIYSPDTRSSSYGTHGLWYFLGPSEILERIPQIASYKATQTSGIKEDILLKELGELGFVLQSLMPAQHSNRPYNCWVFIRWDMCIL